MLWAVVRDYEQGDPRARRQIESKLGSVFDLWSAGTTYYYGQNTQPKTA